jgi:hypothetical protein|tara:strand:+ start:32628 stop:32870 length:243 start_codon:yes stop_codon:yes gene_type:complete
MNDFLKNQNQMIEDLVEIAMEAEITDPIDWGELNISEEEAYKMFAATVLEMNNEPLADKAIIVKLLVENFVLNLKLLGKK